MGCATAHNQLRAHGGASARWREGRSCGHTGRIWPGLGLGRDGTPHEGGDGQPTWVPAVTVAAVAVVVAGTVTVVVEVVVVVVVVVAVVEVTVFFCIL